jgi:folate-binding protein YgfZ
LHLVLRVPHFGFARPTHAWLISADGGKATRLTSGSWTLPSNPPPNSPSSPLMWSPDGSSLAIVRQELPHDGDNDKISVQILDVATGKTRALTGKKEFESCPTFSPDGLQVAYCYPRDGDYTNINEVHIAPLAGGNGRNLTRKLDRAFYQAFWMPDSKAVLCGGNDGNRASMWMQPLDGPAKRLELGVPDGSRDLIVDKALLLENGFDELNGVDWQKGCYMGQELTARTKYRALIRKRLFPVRIEGALPAPGTSIYKDGQEVGELRSGSGQRALAMLRLEAVTAGQKLMAGDVGVLPEIPAWMRLPDTADP